MIVFSRSWALLLFLIFPIFFLLKYFKLLEHYKIYLNLIKWQDVKAKSNNFVHLFLSFLYRSCLFLAVTFTIFTIAEPGVYKQTKSYCENASSLMFLLDISPSMASKDIDENVDEILANDADKKTRFFIAKKIISDVARRHKGASFALSTFAQHAALIVLPTIDFSTFFTKE